MTKPKFIIALKAILLSISLIAILLLTIAFINYSITGRPLFEKAIFHVFGFTNKEYFNSYYFGFIGSLFLGTIPLLSNFSSNLQKIKYAFFCIGIIFSALFLILLNIKSGVIINSWEYTSRLVYVLLSLYIIYPYIYKQNK